MDPYLTPADRSIVPEFETLEVVYGKNQPEYKPLRTLRSSSESGNVLSRWTLTDEQRQAIAEGADIFLDVMTFHGALQPVRLLVAHELDASSVAESLKIAIPIDTLPTAG